MAEVATMAALFSKALSALNLILEGKKVKNQRI